MPLIAMAGLVAALRALYPRWAEGLVWANVVTVLVIYLPTLVPGPGSGSYSGFALLAAAASLVAFLLLACAGTGPPWVRLRPGPDEAPVGATVAPADD